MPVTVVEDKLRRDARNKRITRCRSPTRIHTKPNVATRPVAPGSVEVQAIVSAPSSFIAVRLENPADRGQLSHRLTFGSDQPCSVAVRHGEE